jgi:dynein heavy chain
VKLPSLSKSYRVELTEKKWIPALNRVKPAILFTENKDFLEDVCDEVQFAEWNNQGLPSDRTSIENGMPVNLFQLKFRNII